LSTDLALAQCQNYWFTRHYTITVFDWPANSPDLNSRQSIGYCQEEDEKHPNQQYRRAEGHYESTLAFKAQQRHRLIASMPRCIDAFKLKEP